MYDLIIIGAGPAGLTAGLYAGRFRLNSLILEKLGPGGQIILSSTIDNFPGFPEGTPTQELIDSFKKQVDKLGIKIDLAPVIEISASPEFKKPLYEIKTKDKAYQAASVIIASGAQPKRIEVPGENKFTGRGVSYCATCDGPLYKGKDVVVIGGGDRAMEEVIFLANYANRVTVIHRRQELRASKILEEKAKENPKINFILDSVVEEIIGQGKVDSVRIKNLKTSGLSTVTCQGVFIFIGMIPNTAFLKSLLHMDGAGFIITDETLATSRQGLYAAGDCRKKSLYQVVTACADGAIAADSVFKYLNE